MKTGYIAFGGNLGDPPAAFEAVAARLRESPEIAEVRASRLVRTVPVGGPAGQAPYYNGCYEVRTSLTAHELFEDLREIEADFGRDRVVHWAPRAVDLDLILFDDLVINDERLTVPHPRMHFRRFVLDPLAELNPFAVHPILRRTIDDLSASVGSLAVSPLASMCFLGGEPETAAWFFPRFQAGQTSRTYIPLPADSCPVRLVPVGGTAVAAQFPVDLPVGAERSLRSSLEALYDAIEIGRLWLVLAETPKAEPSATEVLLDRVVPVVDCRAPTTEGVRQNLHYLLSSIEPVLDAFDDQPAAM